VWGVGDCTFSTSAITRGSSASREASLLPRRTVVLCIMDGDASWGSSLREAEDMDSWCKREGIGAVMGAPGP
jgi:hypothetical protein